MTPGDFCLDVELERNKVYTVHHKGFSFLSTKVSQGAVSIQGGLCAACQDRLFLTCRILLGSN